MNRQWASLLGACDNYHLLRQLLSRDELARRRRESQRGRTSLSMPVDFLNDLRTTNASETV